MPWYVVADNTLDGAYDDLDIWTVSKDQNSPGWATDCAFDGYGLPKHVAQFLADAANEKEQRDGVRDAEGQGEMTDLDIFRDMLKRAGIDFIELDRRTNEGEIIAGVVIEVERGYPGFVSRITFDADGALHDLEAYE